MNNLENFNCIYASLSESSYNGRPNAFPKYQNSKEKEEFNYSLDVIDEKGDRTKGGQNLPNSGIVYLQPDNTVKTIQIEKINHIETLPHTY